MKKLLLSNPLPALLGALLLLPLGVQSLFAAEPPTLIVVVSVDQLAYEYLERFERNFSPNGLFRRVEKEGAWFTECHHRHAFTYTAAGHAVQLTGCYPSEHGIIQNDWFERATGKSTYCVHDDTVRLLGDEKRRLDWKVDDEPVSPRRLLADTVGDRMKLATNRRSKVFGVAIKDRASILMCGHLADAAYWMSNNGNWITADYYRSDLPGYLRALNERDDVERFFGQSWEPLYEPAKYLHGPVEDSFGERPVYGMMKDFPHKLDTARTNNYIKQLAASPMGNDATLAAAKVVMEAEELGLDEFPDLLCINLSSNDYVGHTFGPHSLEVEDMTYRTDEQLGAFVRHIEEKMAGRPWLLALTADHAVCPIPELMAKWRLPSGRDPLGKEDLVGNHEIIRLLLEKELRTVFTIAVGEKESLVLSVQDNEVFLDRDHPKLRGERYVTAQKMTRDFLLKHPAVAAAITREQMLNGQATSKLEQMFQRAFHAQRSGDVLFVMQPYFIHGGAGTTHGSPWRYDTHVPLLLLAGGKAKDAGLIKPGRYHTNVSPAMLAPTLAKLLRIETPSKCVEEPIVEVLGR